MYKKPLIILLLAAIAGIGVYVGSTGYLSLDALRQYQAELEQWVGHRPILSRLGFVGLYVAVTALSIPGAVIMTLAGGALFGLLWGTVLVSFSSTIGATAAFLIARTVARSLVRDKFGDRLAKVRRGLERDGAFYLFSLRLVPVIPFFVINIVMALTPIRTTTFFFVSQLGMLPATVVYVNAGTQLARVSEVGDILSAQMFFAFALLAAFPWLAKGALRLAGRR